MRKKFRITGRTYPAPVDIIEVKATNSWIIAKIIIFLFRLKHDGVEIEVLE